MIKVEICKKLKSDDPFIHAAILEYPLTKKQLDLIINDDSPGIRSAIMGHQSATKEHLDIGMKDKVWLVRYSAITNPNATKEHLFIGINDLNEKIRRIALNKITSKIPNSIIRQHFNPTFAKFIGTKEDWDNICLLYL